MHWLSEHFKNIVDGVSVLTFIGVASQILPVVAGVFTVVWSIYRIKEIRLSIKLKQRQLEE